MRVAVIGATGYTGLELLRWLHVHPKVEISMICSETSSGMDMAAVYPHLHSIYHQTLEKVDLDELASRTDIAMIALPTGLSTEWVPLLLERGLRVIDLAGDFRLSAEQYEKWYRKCAPSVEIQKEAVYGLSEWNSDEIQEARFVSNPGCFPTATLLGLLPLIKSNLVHLNSIIVDAKSGVSGAGKGLSMAVHFSEVNENFKAYKVGQHQHTPEIEAQLEKLTGQPMPITFTTHLVPMTRGILATCYGKLTKDMSTNDLVELYKSTYEGRPFVRIRNAGEMPQTKDVAHSNFCDIGIYVDERTGRVTVVSVIDNLVKGASGQAIQNLNVMLGLNEKVGLWHTPAFL